MGSIWVELVFSCRQTQHHTEDSLVLILFVCWVVSSSADKMHSRWMSLRCLRDLGRALFGIKMAILSRIIMSFAAPLISGFMVLICVFDFFS